jgi:hypothetical protein
MLLSCPALVPLIFVLSDVTFYSKTFHNNGSKIRRALCERLVQ